MILKKLTVKKLISAVVIVGILPLAAGCGQTSVPEQEESVVLIDPPAVEANYETVIRRNLLSAETYTAVVSPMIRQYGLESGITFEAYDVYPGQEVKKGRTLLHGNSESIDKSIESLETSIAEAEENYNEYMAENIPKHEELLRKMEDYEETMEELSDNKPLNWETSYAAYEKAYVVTHQEEIELEQAIREKRELYEIDHSYQLAQLQYLKQDKQKTILTAGMSGVVADMKILTNGDRVSGGQKLAALADLTRKELKCSYIAQDTILKAEEIYAIVNGRRFEVEYVPLDTAEYTRLKNQNGTVYSTFTFLNEDDTSQISFGDSALLVIVSQRKENVLAVSSDVIRSEGTVKYVYVLNGNKREYTVVKTGDKDGMFTEITSGLEEGDLVVRENALTSQGAEQILEKGEVGLTLKLSGRLYYPFSEWIKNDINYGTVFLEEILVQENQSVEKGELLARIRVEGDNQTLQKNKKKLQREEERLADLKAKEEPDEKAVESKEATISELRELIRNMESDYAATEIRSSKAGVVTGIGEFSAGDTLPKGAKLIQVADRRYSVIKVEDEKNQLVYGQEVSISYTGGDGQKTITGHVISLDPMSADKTLTDKTALIQVSEEDRMALAAGVQGPSGRWRGVLYNIQTEVNEMKNVVVVPGSAVKKSGGNTYVKVKLENGEVVYQSFLAGGSDYVNYWVVEGLTEGMKICLE